MTIYFVWTFHSILKFSNWNRLTWECGALWESVQTVEERSGKYEENFANPQQQQNGAPTNNLRPKKGQNKNSPRCGQQLTPGGSHTTHRRRCHGNEWSSVRQKIPSSTLNDFNGNFIKVNRYTGGTDPREKVRLRRVKPLHQIGSRWLSAILAATPNKIIGEIFF